MVFRTHPPPPSLEVMTFFFFFVVVVACQLVPPENEDLSLGEDFCSFFLGGGGCQLKNLVPPMKTQGPPVPPYWKIPSYATVYFI